MNTRLLAGLGLLGALVVFAAAGLWATPWDAVTLDWAHLAAPPGDGAARAAGHWLGTDRLGRDLLARAGAGLALSLGVGLGATLVAVLIGVPFGAIAGLRGGRIDEWLMRGVDVLYALPFVFLAILLSVTLGRAPWLVFIVLGAVGWLGMARVVRGEALALRARAFVDASRVMGAGHAYLLRAHLLPNLRGPILVVATLTVPQMVLAEGFLSFLGLTFNASIPSLGTLLADGTAEMESAPWLLWVPATLLVLLVLALNWIGDGLAARQDVAAPREATA